MNCASGIIFYEKGAASAEAEPKEWLLAPPRAFVFDEVGSNGSINGWSDELRENYYAVYMEAIVSSDGETLVAKTTVPRKEQANAITAFSHRQWRSKSRI